MSNRTATFAIAAASVSVLMSLIAVGVVASRGGEKSTESAQLTVEASVAASDIVKLKRDSVTTGATGVRVTDDRLRVALGLQTDDEIVMLGGRVIKRERDITDVLVGASMFEVVKLDVDVLRDGKPLLMRWKIDGDLRSARRTPSAPTLPSTTPDPWSPSPTRDPMLDTIRKIDDTHYEVPRSTIDTVLANPIDFTKGARVVPAYKSGMIEGFKLYAIRPGSIWKELGFQNGDTVNNINGYEVESLDKVLELVTKIRDASSLDVQITRRGRLEMISIDVK
jgi:type II secretory pathway component PulC